MLFNILTLSSAGRRMGIANRCFSLCFDGFTLFMIHLFFSIWMISSYLLFVLIAVEAKEEDQVDVILKSP